jgi:5-methylcytosine-specific restriction endonuclease McrA
MSPSYISGALRQRVAVAAYFRCGYCLTSQRIIGPLLEIDHIVPEARGGTSDEENLWLARPISDLPLKKALEFPILSNISTSCMDLA